jgi:hypothetical protein
MKIERKELMDAMLVEQMAIAIRQAEDYCNYFTHRGN